MVILFWHCFRHNVGGSHMKHCNDCNRFGLTVIATGVCVRTNKSRDFNDNCCEHFIQNPRLIRTTVQVSLEEYI